MPRRTYGFARNHENQWRTRIRCPKRFAMTKNNLEMYLECLREVSGGKFDAIQQSSKGNFHGNSIMYIGIWELRIFVVSWDQNFQLSVSGECEKKSKITKIFSKDRKQKKSRNFKNLQIFHLKKKKIFFKLWKIDNWKNSMGFLKKVAHDDQVSIYRVSREGKRREATLFKNL